MDFSKLAEEAALVILRGQVGTTADTKFQTYAAECRKYGIPFGVYCYSKASSVSQALSEAETFWNNTHAANPKFYCMDAETANCSASIIAAFAQEMRSCGAKKLGCYVAHHMYETFAFDTVRSKFDFVWIPRYAGNDTGKPDGKKPAYTCDLWQYTEKGRCSGVTGYCDLNKITGTGKTLSWFIS